MTREELIRWRKEHNLTQQELADLLHVRQVTVARWEIELRKIPPFLHLALIGLETLIKKKKGGEKGYGVYKQKKRPLGN